MIRDGEIYCSYFTHRRHVGRSTTSSVDKQHYYEEYFLVYEFKFMLCYVSIAISL